MWGLTAESDTPEVCGKLPAVEGVTAEEGERTAGPVVPAVDALCLQLQTQLQGSVHHHLRQGRRPFKWS